MWEEACRKWHLVRDFPVVQWLRIQHALQGTRVQSLVRKLRSEVPEATKSKQHNWRAHALRGRPRGLWLRLSAVKYIYFKKPFFFKKRNGILSLFQCSICKVIYKVNLGFKGGRIGFIPWREKVERPFAKGSGCWMHEKLQPFLHTLSSIWWLHFFYLVNSGKCLHFWVTTIIWIQVMAVPSPGLCPSRFLACLSIVLWLQSTTLIHLHFLFLLYYLLTLLNK